MTADPLTAKDIAVVALSAGSLIVTIVWNITNRRHTDKVARDIRAETFELSEWREKRSDIFRALRDFENAADKIELLGRGALTNEALREQLNDVGRAATECHLKLARELARAGPHLDWANYAYGFVANDGESEWDQFASALAEAEVEDDIEKARATLVDANAHARGISKRITDVIQERNAHHDPKPPSKK